MPSAEIVLPSVAFVGPLQDRRAAREWALVLQSQSIAYVMRPSPEGWLLQVAAHDEKRAWASIDLYEQENENWPPPKTDDTPRHPASFFIPVTFLLLAWFFAGATGPVSSGSSWFREGRADALLLDSEPWRMVTALTLHADAKHVLGNIISGSIFGAVVGRRFGPGGALFAIVIGGAFGNAANALYHLPGGHRSIGASTAVFAAVGILAGVQTIMSFTGKRPAKLNVLSLFGPVIGGLALLGSLGAAPDSDLGAHGFGFGAGVLIGLIGGYLVRQRDAEPSGTTQGLLGACGLGIVLASWAMAMG